MPAPSQSMKPSRSLSSRSLQCGSCSPVRVEAAGSAGRSDHHRHGRCRRSSHGSGAVGRAWHCASSVSIRPFAAVCRCRRCTRDSRSKSSRSGSRDRRASRSAVAVVVEPVVQIVVSLSSRDRCSRCRGIVDARVAVVVGRSEQGPAKEAGRRRGGGDAKEGCDVSGGTLLIEMKIGETRFSSAARLRRARRESERSARCHARRRTDHSGRVVHGRRSPCSSRCRRGAAGADHLQRQVGSRCVERNSVLPDRARIPPKPPPPDRVSIRLILGVLTPMPVTGSTADRV